MKTIINNITAFVLSLTQLLIFVIFGTLIYNELPNLLGIVICILLLLTSIWLAIILFKTIKNRGLLELITILTATPDMDNLEVSADSSTKKRTAKEFAEVFNNKENIFAGGVIQIFGDWIGKTNKDRCLIVEVKYNETEKLLELSLSGNIKIHIIQPTNILESPSFFKVISAKSVKIWYSNKGKTTSKPKDLHISYDLVGRRIKTESNFGSDVKVIDAYAGKPALFICD